jgi:hypothetical protein
LSDSPSLLVILSTEHHGMLGSVFSPDVSRVEATGKHIARGLHFSFCDRPLRLDYKLFVQSKPGYDSIDFVIPAFAAFYEKCSGPSPRICWRRPQLFSASTGNAHCRLMPV